MRTQLTENDKWHKHQTMEIEISAGQEPSSTDTVADLLAIGNSTTYACSLGTKP